MWCFRECAENEGNEDEEDIENGRMIWNEKLRMLQLWLSALSSQRMFHRSSSKGGANMQSSSFHRQLYSKKMSLFNSGVSQKVWLATRPKNFSGKIER